MKKLALSLLLLIAAPLSAQITGTTNSVSFTCTGSNGPYPFTFPVFDGNGFEVIETLVSSGTSTTLPTSAYTSTPVNNSYINGGSVNLVSPCVTGYSLTIQRATEQTQLDIFTQNMPTLYPVFQSGLDKLTMEVQDDSKTPRVTSITPGLGISCTPDIYGSCTGPVQLNNTGVTGIVPGVNTTCSPNVSGTCSGVVTVNASGGGGGSLPTSTAANQAPVALSSGSTIYTPTTLDVSLQPDAVGQMQAKAFLSPYYGLVIMGDSGLLCYGMAAQNPFECAGAQVAQDLGAQLISGPYGGTTSLGYTVFAEVVNHVHPTILGNPITLLNVGANDINFYQSQYTASPTTYALGHEQNMYALASMALASDYETYWPDDSTRTSTTGTWTPYYNFYFVNQGYMGGGAGCSVGDVITVPGLNNAQITIDSVNGSGAVNGAFGFHVSQYPTTTPLAIPSNAQGTGGTCTSQPYWGSGGADNYSSTDTCTGTCTLAFNNVQVNTPDVFLIYEAFPPSGVEGYVPGATFSVYEDGSSTPMTDAITGQTVFSANYGQASQEAGSGSAYWFGFNFGFKALKLGPVTAGTHTFSVQTTGSGTIGIRALVSFQNNDDVGINGPNLDDIGIWTGYGYSGRQPGYTAFSNVQYAMVQDLAQNFGRHVTYTDFSSLDTSEDYFVSPSTEATVTNCGISSGTITITAANSFTPGEQEVLDNLTNCAIANQLPLTVQTANSTSFTATVQNPAKNANRYALSIATVSSAAEPSLAVAMPALGNGWIANGEQPHPPQNLNKQMARKIENELRAIPGANPTANGLYTNGGSSSAVYAGLYGFGGSQSASQINNGSTAFSGVQPWASFSASTGGGWRFGNGPLKNPTNWYLEIAPNRMTRFPTCVATSSVDCPNYSDSFDANQYNTGVNVAATVGTGYTTTPTTGTVTFSGFTCTHQPSAVVLTNGSGGVNYFQTSPGSGCTGVGTITISLTTSGTPATYTPSLANASQEIAMGGQLITSIAPGDGLTYTVNQLNIPTSVKSGLGAAYFNGKYGGGWAFLDDSFSFNNQKAMFSQGNLTAYQFYGLPNVSGQFALDDADANSCSSTIAISNVSSFSRVTLTANCSFTLAAPTSAGKSPVPDGFRKSICFKQGPSSAYTVTAPANVHGFFASNSGAIGSTLGDWNCQDYRWDNVDSIYLATNGGIVNE